MNKQELISQIKKKRSFLCVGLDSDIEKGIRLQSLIDRAQSAGIRDNMNNIHDNGKKIQENKDDIEALKKGKK